MSDESARTEPQSWPWQDSLDALTAASECHRLILENDCVRVLDVRIAPGQLVPVHTHRWPGVYHVLSAGDFIRRDAAGNVLFDSRTVANSQMNGRTDWLPPFPPHSVENVGATEIRIISVEVKQEKA
jgi:predicted metal-dependent enzyme (double-stranded beta helix superfamily)